MTKKLYGMFSYYLKLPQKDVIILPYKTTLEAHMKKLSIFLLTLIITISTAMTVCAASETDEILSDDIVILYTNDVHTYIDGELSYDTIAAIKKELRKDYKYVILADAGDHVQGTAYGSMDDGKTIIRLMNSAGYDVATLGNHEFDYGMEGCLDTIESADFKYVSANFYHEKNGVRGENVLDSYTLFDCGDQKVAFVGITTPETFTSTTPAYFQNDKGEYIYGIAGGDDGSLLCADVTKAIEDAKNDGATKVIALGHLGEDMSASPWTSVETIAGVCGLDAFIDAHSHTRIDSEYIKDKNGHDVLLTQTGCYFSGIGIMIIDAETGKIEADIIELEEISADESENRKMQFADGLYGGKEVISDKAVAEIKNAWIKEIDTMLNVKIGETELVFDNYDADGNRIVRKQETNTGDFAADSLYHLFDNMDMNVDVAIINGGGVRNKALTGDITYKTCKLIHTFGNVACLQEVTGQQLLDALEWGARMVGTGECGGFLHTSGLTYKIDSSVPSTVKQNEKSVWTGAPEKYRVYDVKVYNKETDTYEPLDTGAKYNLAGYNYTLRDLGDGYAMFDGAVNILDYVMEDYMVLANYVKSFDGGVIKADNSVLSEKYPGFLLDYGKLSGSGRIDITEGYVNPFSDVSAEDWFSGEVEFVVSKGIFKGTSEKTFSPDNTLTRAMLVTALYRLEGEPAANRSIPFADVDMGAYYANAAAWAKQTGIVNGITEREFAPDIPVTREQTVAILYRYLKAKEYDLSVGENTNILSYDDFSEISEYAVPAMQYAVGSGLLKGRTNTTLDPKETLTRAEAAALFRRFVTAEKH